MEKRSTVERDSIVEDAPLVREKASYQVKLEPPASVWIQCSYPAKVNVIGSVTGRKYAFNGSGSHREVDAKDVPKMLEKVHGMNSCCGVSKPRPYFTII